jgi:hypothetical protein
MALNIATPWHRSSYDRLMRDSLPELLAARVPLSGYSVESADDSTCRIKLAVAGSSGDIEIEFADIPQPDELGLFQVDGGNLVVLPLASSENLEAAEIKCVGEQLYDYIEERLGEAPKDIAWDAALAKTWVPLDGWVREFLAQTGQKLDETDGLSRCTHLRRIRVRQCEKVIAPGQFGRVCPFEVPEGPNIGHIFTVAVGAEIRDGRLVIVDDRPEANLGVIASMIPFLEHNDPNRVTLGANMIRQWMPPPDPEPALVQTGNELSIPDFWCGRNLLTAFVSWGPDNYEDGILISESCAKRLNYPDPVEPGDKLSNRHGAKGVVSRILPDDEMPHMPDGTAVELVYNFIALHARLNFGQMREAVASRIARAEGTPFIAPPFHAPDADEIRERLRAAGLPEDGMVHLTMGKSGKELPRPSTVGWVYWGKTVHAAGSKIHMSVYPGNQRMGGLEYYALRDVGAYETIREQFNTRSAKRPGAEEFVARVKSGTAEQADTPTPEFMDLRRRLAAVGISAELSDGRLRFGFTKPADEATKLAQPIPHPWLSEQTLTEIGVYDELPEYQALVEANLRMQRMMESAAPESLRQRALVELEQRVKDYFDVLLTPDQLKLGSLRVMFSGRTVLAPGIDLRLDQVGIADEMAWTLFSPLVIGEIGAEKEVIARTKRAAKSLDEIMARSWLIVNRAPTVIPTAILAFHPVRVPDNTIRLHPLACMLMNADFDGDQAAVFLPVTKEGQEEAGRLLSIAGHLRRDPSIIGWLCPSHETLWGLAQLSMSAKIQQIIGADVAAPEGYITRSTLSQALKSVMERDGIERALEVAQQLQTLGFDVAKASGASLNPFIGETLSLPPAPDADDPEAWSKYVAEIGEALISRADFSDGDLGPQLLAVKSGARGSLGGLQRLVGPTVVQSSIHGDCIPIRHGFNEGLTPEEMFICIVGAREGLQRTAIECIQAGYGVRGYSQPKGFSVLNRAMRSGSAGIVFARAAAIGESDPLADVDSRLFVGLPATW